mmetsp:Transcript_4412/g.13482  ORF Transcript_4412/g.13482 Transcript_4412/m.13482 type:complete len:289 (-) Transcript_4412:1595-2461(-)
MCNYYIYIYLITSTKHQTLALPRDNSILPLAAFAKLQTQTPSTPHSSPLFSFALSFSSRRLFPSEAHFPSYLSLTPPISRTVSDRRRQTVSSRSLPARTSRAPLSASSLVPSPRSHRILLSSKTSPSLAPKSPFGLFLSSRRTYRNTFVIDYRPRKPKIRVLCPRTPPRTSHATSLALFRALSSLQETKVFLLLATDASETCSSTRQTRSRRPRKYRRGSEPISRRFQWRSNLSVSALSTRKTRTSSTREWRHRCRLPLHRRDWHHSSQKGLSSSCERRLKEFFSFFF